MKKIYFLILVTLLVACKKEQEPVIAEKSEIPEVENCMCPPVVYLQPCNTFTEAEAMKLIPVLEKAITDNTGLELYVDVLPNVKLPKKSLKSDIRDRYRAEKVINYFKDKPHNETIILLHDDISSTKGNIPDYGIQGLSIMNKHTCVASDFRLKDKSQFWKVIMHEFFHSYCKLHHCPKGDKSCLIVEGPMRASEKKLCNYCRSKINYESM